MKSNIRKKFRRLTAMILGICMLSGYAVSVVPVYAEDTGAASGTDAVQKPKESNAAQGPETNQSGLKENSWRYQDGKPLEALQISARSVPYPNAWEKVNGVYVNNYGDPIKGAVKKGIDVSEHQGKIDWNKVKADGIDYAILRCGYGDDYPSQDDRYWVYNVSECERLGIPYGVYIYSYATNVEMAASEANHVLRLIRGRNFTYPVYFDMEDDSTVNVSADMKGQMAQKFADIITGAGYRVGIYANLNWFTNQLTSPVFDNPSWSKWVAQYNSTCDYNKPYDMWQYTSTGRVDGIAGNVDTNFLMDTYKENAPGPAPSPDPVPEPDTGGTTLAVRRGNQYFIKYSLSSGPADLTFNYGYANDTILVGDWDGDGVDTLCVRRGNTYYFKNSLTSGAADTVVKYGRASDEVLVGDWNGDGVDTLCVRRGNTYYIKNSLSNGEADSVVKYGRKDDVVMTGDWDGDGVDTLCVRRGNTYYIKNSLADGEADSTIAYGKASDDILAGDWNGDGKDTLCVRRGNEYHIKNSIQAGNADKIIKYGKKDDITYAGKWK